MKNMFVEQAYKIIHLSKSVKELLDFADKLHQDNKRNELQFPFDWFANLKKKYFGVHNDRSSAYQNDIHCTYMDNQLKEYIAKAFRKRAKELKKELKLLIPNK